MVPFLTSQLLSFFSALLITTSTYGSTTSPRHFLHEAGYFALSSPLGVGPKTPSLPPSHNNNSQKLSFYYDQFDFASAELLSSWACTALSEGGR